jgi:hypothetical protein
MIYPVDAPDFRHVFFTNRYASVNMATDCKEDDRNSVRVDAGTFCIHIQTGFGTHPLSHSVIWGGALTVAVEWLELEANHS